MTFGGPYHQDEDREPVPLDHGLPGTRQNVAIPKFMHEDFGQVLGKGRNLLRQLETEAANVAELRDDLRAERGPKRLGPKVKALREHCNKVVAEERGRLERINSALRELTAPPKPKTDGEMVRYEFRRREALDAIKARKPGEAFGWVIESMKSGELLPLWAVREAVDPPFTPEAMEALGRIEREYQERLATEQDNRQLIPRLEDAEAAVEAVEMLALGFGRAAQLAVRDITDKPDQRHFIEAPAEPTPTEPGPTDLVVNGRIVGEARNGLPPAEVN